MYLFIQLFVIFISLTIPTFGMETDYEKIFDLSSSQEFFRIKPLHKALRETIIEKSLQQNSINDHQNKLKKIFVALTGGFSYAQLEHFIDQSIIVAQDFSLPLDEQAIFDASFTLQDIPAHCTTSDLIPYPVFKRLLKHYLVKNFHCKLNISDDFLDLHLADYDFTLANAKDLAHKLFDLANEQSSIHKNH